ncbi:uncharacterized protein LOC117586170 [Drosophila guanche]|uniref:uncharacterized protein LOC117586170 n=1 Tax=Drosophila guanche TaxID=7266 RepID=UPI0014712488|nr:uncharacterized protein LOC117586170 [Drosophila guanche]
MEGKRKSKKRDANFRSDEKISLIKAVEARPCMWLITDKKHFDKIALKRAWESVAAEMNKEVNECRDAWTSLRDSLRYHRSKLAKSGSAGGSDFGEPRVKECVDWQFAEHMAFLPVNTLERRTKTSCFTFVDSPACSPDECSSPVPKIEEISIPACSDDDTWLSEDDVEACKSTSYSYSNSSKRPKAEEPTSSTTDGLAGLLGDYLKNKKKTRAVFPFWDKLLSKLPEDVATATEVEITNLLFSKVQQEELQYDY